MYLNLKLGLDHPFEPRSAGPFSQDFTICLSLQCGASSRDLLGKSQSPSTVGLVKSDFHDHSDLDRHCLLHLSYTFIFDHN